MFAGLSLRARLLLGLIVLAALGLGAADIATYTSLRSFLITRTDKTLDTAHRGVETALSGRGGPDQARQLAQAAPGDYIRIQPLAGGLPQEAIILPPRAERPPYPKLPGQISLPRTPNAGPDRVRYFTAPAESGGEHWRVRAAIEEGLPGDLLIIATRLNDVESTLHRLLVIELLVTVAVLAALTALGLWAVRLGLRPLEAMGETAAAIAAGDLSRRVEPAEPRTEVGRLGLALNAMLSQIESAFKAREASERRLRRFVADASHELRTPLAAIRGYAELFGRGADKRPEDLARTMSGISRESERMSRLVEDLLLLARLDEGRPLEREPVDLERVLCEAVETAQAVEPARPIELVSEPAEVLGDRDRLRQVIDNLLSNVRSHTPPGSPVRVELARQNGRAVIEVADQGPGMSAEEAERVFERFYRVDASRSRASGGVGLGLSIVAAVTKAHGGTVAAHSTPGEGATFEVALPLLTPSSNGSAASQS